MIHALFLFASFPALAQLRGVAPPETAVGIDWSALPEPPKARPGRGRTLLPPALRAAAESLFARPLIENSASGQGLGPLRPARVSYGGPFLRIGLWNTNDRVEALRVLSGKDPRWTGDFAALGLADVLAVNETGLDAAQEFARAAGYNLAFGASLVQVGRQAERLKQEGRPATAVFHGNALFSRYPILDAQLIPLASYDWQNRELEWVDPIEKARRGVAKAFFGESVKTQVRVGNDGRFRSVLIVTLSVPEAPGGRWTVAVTQLENYAPPSLRRDEVDSILEQLKPIRGPVVLLGDFNSSGRDVEPTSLKREGVGLVKHPQSTAMKAIFIAQRLGAGIPYITPVSAGIYAANHLRTHGDPSARSIPIVGGNGERTVLARFESFRFDDGVGFYREADRGETLNGHGGKWAGANERAWKGFKETYRTGRSYPAPLWYGREKTDWMFAKDMGPLNALCPGVADSLNRAPKGGGQRLSDHAAIWADFPLAPPPGFRPTCR